MTLRPAQGGQRFAPGRATTPPKAEVSEKSPPRPGYWWLAYEWANLLLACKTCNEQYKKAQFPIRGTRATKPDDSLEEEMAWLLDPASDDVEGALSFDWVTRSESVLIYGIGHDGERANKTVRVVGLNRASLARERWDDLQPLKRVARNMIRAQEEGLEGHVQKLAAEIRRITSKRSAVPFVGMRRHYFQALDLHEFVSTD